MASNLAAALSRRSSKSSNSGGPTSADQLLVSLVEKSLLSLGTGATEDTSELPETVPGVVPSPEGSKAIRSLVSEMVESVDQSDSESSSKPKNAVDNECKQFLGQLLDTQFNKDLVDARNQLITPVYPLISPPIVPLCPKPKDLLLTPKVKPEKPSKITLKYLLETIDGDTDDDNVDISPATVMAHSASLFASTSSSDLFASSKKSSTISEKETEEMMILSTSVQSTPTSTLTTTFEQSTDGGDNYNYNHHQKLQTFENSIQQYNNSNSQDFDSLMTDDQSNVQSQSNDSFRRPLSMPIMSALSALESLESSHHHQISSPSPPETGVVDYLTDLRPETTLSRRDHNQILSEKTVVPTTTPEITDLANINQEILDAEQQTVEQRPPTDNLSFVLENPALLESEDKLDSKIEMTTSKVEEEKESPTSPPSSESQKICVELLKDIVEMASDKVATAVDDNKESDELHQETSAKHQTDIGCEKTAEDVEVSKLFSSSESTFVAKRRRSLELFVCLTNHRNSKSPSPLICSTKATGRSSSLDIVDELTTILGSSSSKTGQLTESRSTPESRASSPTPLMDINTSDSPSSSHQRRRSPTPVISTTDDDAGDHPSSPSKRSETGDANSACHSSLLQLQSNYDDSEEVEEGQEKFTETFEELSPKSSPLPLPPPVATFRARSRSLVIDVCSSHNNGHSELSLKTTTTTTESFASRFCANKRAKRSQLSQGGSNKPVKKTKIGTPEKIELEKKENDDDSNDDENEITESTSAGTGQRKEPSVQHPDISSSVDDRRDSTGCTFKVAAQHRQCCCGRSETMLFETAEEDEEEEEMELETEPEVESCSRGSKRHRGSTCCHRHGSSSTKLIPLTDTSSSSSTMSSTTTTSHHHHLKTTTTTTTTLLPPPVTIHHHSSAGLGIPTVSINFNAENATTIIHINPNSGKGGSAIDLDSPDKTGSSGESSSHQLEAIETLDDL